MSALHGVTTLTLLDLELDKGSQASESFSKSELRATGKPLLAAVADLKKRNPALEVFLVLTPS